MSIKKNKHKSTGELSRTRWVSIKKNKRNVRELYAMTRVEMEKMHWDGWVCATSVGYLLGDGNVNEGLKQHMVTFWDPSGFDFMVLRTRRAAENVCREWNATLKGKPTIFRDECRAFPVRVRFGLELRDGR